MAARTIDGPDKDYLTTAEAARYIGVHGKTLKQMADATDWMRQIYIRKRPRWWWFHVVMLSHQIQAASLISQGAEQKK